MEMKRTSRTVYHLSDKEVSEAIINYVGLKWNGTPPMPTAQRGIVVEDREGQKLREVWLVIEH